MPKRAAAAAVALFFHYMFDFNLQRNSAKKRTLERALSVAIPPTGTGSIPVFVVIVHLLMLRVVHIHAVMVVVVRTAAYGER